MAVSLFRELVGDTQRTVRPDGIVVPAPSFDQRPGLGQGVEDLTIEQFVAQRAVEGLAVAFSPGLPGVM